MTGRAGKSARRSPLNRPPKVAVAAVERIARPEPLSTRATWTVVLTLVALWLVLFAPVLDSNRAFVRGDAGRYGAFADLSRARFGATGQRTFWNPYVFLGLPATASLADPRPHWLPDVLLRAWDAVTRTSAGAPLWPALLACLAGAIGAAALARALWGCGPAGSVLTGGLWLLAPGVLVPLAFGHDAQCVTAALMPLTLLLALRAFAAPTVRGALIKSVAFALSLALQTLGGHPQFVVYTALLLVPFAIERASAHGQLRRLAWVGAGTLLAAAMSAGLWLPALRFGAHAQRASAAFAARESGIWSLAPRDLLALVWPHAVGFGDAAYWGGMRGTDFSHTLGLAAVLLALAGLLSRAPGQLAARLCGAVALAGMVLSLGRNFPVVGAVVQSLPILGTFRTPMTWLLITVLAGALLAARGLEAVLTAEPRAWWPRAALAALALGGLLMLMRDPLAESWLAAARPVVEQRIASGLVGRAAFERFAAAASGEALRAVQDAAMQLALAGGALGLIVLLRRRAGEHVRALAGGAVACLALVPLLWLMLPALRAATGPRAALRVQPAPPLALAAAEDPHHRAAWFDREWALSGRWSLANDWVAWRAQQPAGLSGAVPALWDVAARAGLFGERPFLRACAVRHVALPDGAGGDTLAVWSDALPRAHAVSIVRAVASDEGAVAAMHDPAWDAGETAFVVADHDRMFAGAGEVAIDWRRDEPDRVELAVSANDHAYVVLADAWFPGWTARLDGKPVQIERTNLMFRGAVVPAGTHALSFEYEPEGWRLARALALLGWGLFAAAVGVLVMAPRKRSPAATPAAGQAAHS